MKIGVVFPQTEFGNDPAEIKDYAQTAEALRLRSGDNPGAMAVADFIARAEEDEVAGD